MHRQEERRERARIALIGASGHVGGALARLLSAADVRFRALTRDRARTQRMLGSHAEAVVADLRDPFSIEAALVGVEQLFLIDDAPELEPLAITAAERAGVRRIVKSSCAGSGGTVAAAHRVAEEALRGADVAWTVLRPTAFMHSLATMIEETTTRGDTIRLPLGAAAVSWVDCRDVAAVAMHALLEPAHAGCTYVVTGPRALTGAEVAEVLSHSLGRSLRYAPSAPERAVEELRATGLSIERARAIAEQCEVLRSGELATVTDVVAHVAHIEPRTLAHFAARHAWSMECPGASADRSGRADSSTRRL